MILNSNHPFEQRNTKSEFLKGLRSNLMSFLPSAPLQHAKGSCAFRCSTINQLENGLMPTNTKLDRSKHHMYTSLIQQLFSQSIGELNIRQSQAHEQIWNTWIAWIVILHNKSTRWWPSPRIPHQHITMDPRLAAYLLFGLYISWLWPAHKNLQI